MAVASAGPVCKQPAPRSRQTTTPAPHRSVFYRLDALPAAQPTVSKQCTSAKHNTKRNAKQTDRRTDRQMDGQTDTQPDAFQMVSGRR